MEAMFAGLFVPAHQQDLMKKRSSSKTYTIPEHNGGMIKTPKEIACSHHVNFVQRLLDEEQSSCKCCPGCTALKFSMDDSTGSWTTDHYTATVSWRVFMHG